MKKDKSKSLIERFKAILEDNEIELASYTLEDGAVVMAEKLEPGEAVFLVQEDERLPLPVGEYTLEDGSVLVVKEEGVIAEVTAKSEEPAEEELSEDAVKKVEGLVNDLTKRVDELSKEKAELSEANDRLKVAASSQKKGVPTSPEGKYPNIIIPKSKLAMTSKERIHDAMMGTQFYKKGNVNLATTTDITSTYAGEFAGEYIRAATLQGVTLGTGAVTVKENIKFKQVVKRVATTDILGDATCDFTPTGTVTLDERIIEPKELQVNLQLCKDDFQVDWDAIAMGYSAFDVLPPSFQAFFAEQLAAITNEAIENDVWTGVRATAGQLGGFAEGFEADTDVIDVDNASIVIDSSNVIDELGKVADAIPKTIYNTEDLTIYISSNIARAYIRALGGFGAAGLGGSGYMGQGTTGDKPLNFDGIPLFLANGMAANTMVAAQKRNLWYGTGLMNDTNQVKILDMSDIDGSQNVRFIMRFTGDTQHGVGSEVVYYWDATP